MIADYQIQPNTRRCTVSGRELKPGERYYTVLLDDAGRFVRQDYSGEVWQGPPPNAFGFWCGRVPAGDERRKPQIDDELLTDCLTRLEGQTDPNRVNFRFVVALLLMRRKRLKFEESAREGDDEVLVLRCARSGVRHRVLNPRLTEEQMAAVQEEVFKVLGWE
jgi:hypothetical protein